MVEIESQMISKLNFRTGVNQTGSQGTYRPPKKQNQIKHLNFVAFKKWTNMIFEDFAK